MYCTHCGKPTVERENFCTSCGAGTRAGVSPGAPHFSAPAPAPAPAQVFPGDEELSLISRMTDLQRSLYQTRRKDPTVALLLCLFLGGLGAHHFYLGKVLPGVLCIVFCWTFLPMLISLVELFVIMGRTRDYNLMVAQQILQYGVPVAAFARP